MFNLPCEIWMDILLQSMCININANEKYGGGFSLVCKKFKDIYTSDHFKERIKREFSKVLTLVDDKNVDIIIKKLCMNGDVDLLKKYIDGLYINSDVFADIIMYYMNQTQKFNMEVCKYAINHFENISGTYTKKKQLHVKISNKIFEDTFWKKKDSGLLLHFYELKYESNAKRQLDITQLRNIIYVNHEDCYYIFEKIMNNDDPSILNDTLKDKFNAMFKKWRNNPKLRYSCPKILSSYCNNIKYVFGILSVIRTSLHNIGKDQRSIEKHYVNNRDNMLSIFSTLLLKDEYVNKVNVFVKSWPIEYQYKLKNNILDIWENKYSDNNPINAQYNEKEDVFYNYILTTEYMENVPWIILDIEERLNSLKGKIQSNLIYKYTKRIEILRRYAETMI